MIINFATKNKEKIEIAKTALKDKNISLNIIDCKFDEIQSDDTSLIAKISSKEISELYKISVVKIDSGLYIESLNGFPGPYSEYVERKLNEHHILRLLDGEKNRKAYYKESLSYCEYGKEPIIFETITEGYISEFVDESEGYPFDKIFICQGDNKAMCKYTIEERAKKYSHENWLSLFEYLGGNK